MAQKHHRGRVNTESDSFGGSSADALHEEVRVRMNMSKRLRFLLDCDRNMVIHRRHYEIPSRMPVLTILENFVKQTALKMVFQASKNEGMRRRNTQQRSGKKERDLQKLISTVQLLKEVADGLRIYFEFTIYDYLLYSEEKAFMETYLSSEFLRNFIYNPKAGLKPKLLTMKTEDHNDSTSTSAAALQKRKLRSHRNDNCEVILDGYLASLVNVSGTPSSFQKSKPPMNFSIPSKTLDFLHTVLAWRMLPQDAGAVPSMILGAPYLVRLLVKLPDFLNASMMHDAKLKLLLPHLDTFANYIESRADWFGEENYFTQPKMHFISPTFLYKKISHSHVPSITKPPIMCHQPTQQHCSPGKRKASRHCDKKSSKRIIKSAI